MKRRREGVQTFCHHESSGHLGKLTLHPVINRLKGDGFDGWLFNYTRETIGKKRGCEMKPLLCERFVFNDGGGGVKRRVSLCVDGFFGLKYFEI